MTAQMQAIPAPKQAASVSKAQVVAFALLAGMLIVAVALAARIAPPGAAASDQAIGIPSGGLAGPSHFVRNIGPGVPYPNGLAGPSAVTRSLGVPFPGGVAGPSQLTPYVPHTSAPSVVLPPLRISGPLHPPRNTTKHVDPVQEIHQRMV